MLRVVLFLQRRAASIEYSVLTKKVPPVKNGQVKKLHGVRIEWKRDEKGQMKMVEDALGFRSSNWTRTWCCWRWGFWFIQCTRRNDPTARRQFGSPLRKRHVVDANHMTSKEGVFAAGDMAIGQSLVVRAIKQGRNAAKGIDKYLMGENTTAMIPSISSANPGISIYFGPPVHRRLRILRLLPERRSRRKPTTPTALGGLGCRCCKSS